MNKLNARAYSEVYQIIQLLDNDLRSKLPDEIVLFFMENRDLEYEPYFNKYEDLENQKLLNETINVLAFLKLKYWCTTDEEKIFLKQLEENDVEQTDDYETILKQNYYQKYNREIVQKAQGEEKSLTSKSSLWTKIRSFFKNLFSNENAKK